jgi:hypothetical protein
MRTVLRVLGTRYGIALILTLIVLGVVGVTRTFLGTTTEDDRQGPVIETSATPVATGPTLGDDSEIETSERPPQPSVSAGAASAEAVAERFLTAWLKHTGVTAEQWRAGLGPHASQALLAKLKQTDPAGVPADRITGQLRVDRREAALVQVTVPVDSGTVTLRVLAIGGRWQVDGVDWARA